MSLLLEQLAADSDSENSLNDENIFTLRRTKPKVNDTPWERHHFKQGTLDKPFILVADIIWLVKMSKKLKESWIPVQDQQLFFGILVLQNPGTSLWLKRRLGNGELDKQLQPGGEVFLGRGSLIHGGGTMPGVRLHFLYLGDKEREKYHNYTQ